MKTYKEQIEDEDREYYDLCLTATGDLIRRKWKYDEEVGEGDYIETNENLDLFDNLDRYVEIEDGFTLDHLCSLIYDNLDILNVTFKDCWLKEYIAEWEKVVASNSASKCCEYDPDGVEWLEVYKMDEVYGKYIHSSNYPSLHGIGFELKEDKWEDYDSENPAWKAGTRIHWGVGFMKMEDMLNLPIKIDETYHICKDISDKDWSPDNQFVFSSKKKMTLRDVIGGIFWEISFYGGPKDKEEEKEELDRRVDEYKEAKESGDFSKFITVGSPEWDEFENKLKSKGKKDES